MKRIIIVLGLLISALAISQNLRIQDLPAITNSQLASGDLTVVSDISTTVTKKLSVNEIDKRYSFTVDSPLVKTGTENAVLSIPLATGSVSGYLASSDWTTFNAKQSTVSATAPVVFSSNTVSIPKATGSVNGYLASSDWTTFNNKVSLTGSEVLTNKDIDGGTASNTSRITIPKAAKTTLDALTRKQGTIVFDTTSNKPYYDDGSTLKVVGSGSGGGKNFIEGGDAEAGTTGWSTFDDGTVAVPADGTGGSPTVVTWSTTSSTPLEGPNSFTYVKTASNAQGEGVAYTFSVDPSYRAKVIDVSFDYILSSGTFTAGTSSASSDVTVWLYDVTNSQIIQPSSFKLLSNSSTIGDKFKGSFQTSATGASYRLIFFSNSTSTSAYTLKIDNVAVSPTQYVFGTPITDWVPDSTITITAASGTNPTFSSFAAYRRRVGDSMQIRFFGTVSAAGSAAAALLLNMPSGYSIDSNKAAGLGGTGSQGQFGAGSWYDDSNAAKNFSTTFYFNSTSNLGLLNNDGANTLVANTIASPDRVSGFVSVPISGASSSVQMSDQTDTRVVSAIISGTSTVSTSSGVTIVPTTTVNDTHGTMVTATGIYTIPVSGFYRVDGFIRCASTSFSVNNTLALDLMRNGSQVVTLGAATAQAATSLVLSASGSGTYFYNAGDTLNFRATSSVNATLNAFSASIVRVSGPNQIAANELVAASYYSVVSATASGSAPVQWNTRDFDTHNAVTTGSAWKFTAPVSGIYRISASFANATGTVAVQVFKNGVNANAQLFSANTSFVEGGSTTLRLNSGDYIDVRTGSSVTITANTDARVSIERLGL